MADAYEPSDDMVTSERIGDDDRVVQTQNIGVETPGSGEFPDRDAAPDESTGAPGGN